MNRRRSRSATRQSKKRKLSKSKYTKRTLDDLSHSHRHSSSITKYKEPGHSANQQKQCTEETNNYEKDTELPQSDKNLSDKLPKEWTRGKLLGQGRFGRVYLLRDEVKPKDEKFVIKDMNVPENRTDRSMREFRRESEILSILDEHERIVPYYGSLLTERVASIFLSFMKCGSLSQYCEKNGPLFEEKCLSFTKQILHGLKYLHDRRIIHRDIKGSNILLESDCHLRLSDFGISKFLQTASNTMTSDVGTWRWMAPEICNPEINGGKYNFQADIWSVGCTMVEMLAGEVPYSDIEPEPAVIFNVGTAVPPAIPDSVSKGLKKLLSKIVFLKNPEDCPSAEELLIKSTCLNANLLKIMQFYLSKQSQRNISKNGITILENNKPPEIMCKKVL